MCSFIDEVATPLVETMSALIIAYEIGLYLLKNCFLSLTYSL